MSKSAMQHEMPVEILSEEARGINTPIETYKYAAFLIEDGEDTLEGDVFEFTGPALVARAALVSHLFQTVLEQVRDDYNGFTGDQITKIWDEFYAGSKLILDGDLVTAIGGIVINLPCVEYNNDWSFRVYSF